MEYWASFISRFTLLVNLGTKKCAPTFVAKLLFGANGRWNNLSHIFVLYPDLKPTIVEHIVITAKLSYGHSHLSGVPYTRILPFEHIGEKDG